ncbi:MAG: TraC family protein [Oligoflexales bacterium]
MLSQFGKDQEAKALSALFRRPDSLSNYFPYEEVLAKERIVVNKDGSLGVVFRIKLKEHEAMSEEAVVSSVASLKAWFSLPENAVMQVIFEQMPLSPLDRTFSEIEGRHPSPHPVSGLLFEKRLSTVRAASVQESDLTAFERRAFLTIRWFPRGHKGASVTTFFTDPNVTLHKEAGKASAEVTEFLQLVRSFEASSQLDLLRLSGDEFLSVMRRFFNPMTYYQRQFAAYNNSQSLAEQIVYTSPTLSFDGIEREGILTRTISLKTSPSFAYPGGMAYFTRLKFPMRIALNFSFPSKAKVKKFFDLKEFFLENTPSARARRQKEEILDVQERLVRDDRCLHLSFHITLEGKSTEELDARTRDVLSIFHNELECEAIVEKDIGAAMALNSLPLFYSPASDLSACRYIRILRSDVINFLPIFDSFQGLKNPLQLYLSRENNLVQFSLLENETSNHTVVLADSGSGKSSFVIDAVQAAKRLSPEPLVFVIDKKSSYLMLSEYYDADLTVFERDGQMPFSPFRGVFDEEKVIFLTHLLASGIKLMSPSFLVESDHYSVITKAIRVAHAGKCREAGLRLNGDELINISGSEAPTLTMEDVIAEMAALTGTEEFEKFSQVIENLVQKLSPFYGDGMYARYFNAQNSSSKTKSKLFYIYDLDALDSDPVLQSLMTMSVVEEIRQTIKLHRDAGRQGFVVLEELQMLGRGSSVGKQFVLDAAETFRKLGVWLISLTPRPQNYFETEVGQAMWGVADNFIFLQMSSDNVDYVTKHSSLLDEAGLEIVKSLRTVRGSHADVFYVNKKRTTQGAFRFFQTPYDRWLAPTNAKAMLEARKALAKHGDNKWLALEELVEKFPAGGV